jgi:hypothetical protein
MYCAGVLTFDGGFMDSSCSRTKCITERLKTSQRQGCEYRVSPRRAQARRLLSVRKVITRREGGGCVLGVHGAGSVLGPPSPAVLMAAAAASSAGLSNALWPGSIASAASRCATNAARTSTKPFSRSAAPSSPGAT